MDLRLVEISQDKFNKTKRNQAAREYSFECVVRQWKRLMAFTFTLLVVALAVKGMQTYAKGKAEIYPLTTVVIGVYDCDDTVVVEDFNGNHFSFKGTEDWMVGDICSCIMDNNGTEKVYDDKIKETKYCGWIQEWNKRYPDIDELYANFQ